jgi:ATP-binding cassette subfamily C protein LapB
MAAIRGAKDQKDARVEARGAEGTQPNGERGGQEPSWSVSPSAVDFEDPLISCLSVIAGLLHRPVSCEALKAGLPQGRQRFGPELAVRAAARHGIGAKIVHRTKISQILPVTLPCILLLEGGNACVLLAYEDRKSVKVILPEGGGETKVVALDALQEQFTGYAIFAKPEFRFDARAPDVRLKQYKSWFWGTLFQFWPVYSHVLLASVLINCFAIASPLFIMNVYDRVVPNNAIETLWVLAVGVMIVFGFEFLMRNLRTYFVDVAGKNADVLIASRLLEHLMATRLDSKPPSTGAVANNLREFEALREFFTSGTLVALVDLPFIFLFIGVIWLIGGDLAFIPLAAIPLVFLVGLCLQFPLRRVIEKTQREANQKHAILVETIDGLETIKASAAEGRVQRAWERFSGLTADSSGKARFLSGLAVTFAQTSIQFATVLVVVAGVYLIAEGALTMGALVATTILTGRALAPPPARAAARKGLSPPSAAEGGDRVQERRLRLPGPTDARAEKLQLQDRTRRAGRRARPYRVREEHPGAALDGTLRAAGRNHPDGRDRPAANRTRRPEAQHRLCRAGQLSLLRIGARQHRFRGAPSGRRGGHPSGRHRRRQ